MFDLEHFWQQRERRSRGGTEGALHAISPDELLQAAFQYFQWIDKHPIQEEVLFHYQGEIVRDVINKRRPYTPQGLSSFAGITFLTYRALRKHDDYKDAIAFIDQIMFAQKFEGAAIGQFNANLIGRDLGLADRKELSGPEGGPIRQDVTLSEEELDEEIKRRGLTKELLSTALESSDDEAD